MFTLIAVYLFGSHPSRKNARRQLADRRAARHRQKVAGAYRLPGQWNEIVPAVLAGLVVLGFVVFAVAKVA